MSLPNDKSYEWVELLDPKSQRTMYVNLESGECCWEPPKNTAIKPLSSDQWWELFDVKAQRNYYYNSITRETVWQKPETGDIIPLANLQLLQQNMQQATNTSTQDVGMLRRSNSKVSSSSGNRRAQHRKLPTSVLESSTRTTSDLDQPVRNESRDCSALDEGPTHRRTSMDTINLAADQLHRLSSQNTGSSYRPYGNQRVRDWLREAGAAWEHPAGDAIPVSTTESGRNSADRKASGCFSDRPVRRIHSLVNNANGAGLVPVPGQSSLPLVAPTGECMTFESDLASQRTPTEAISSRLTSGQNDSTFAWNTEQQEQNRHSSELPAAQRDLHSVPELLSSSVDVESSASRKSIASTPTTDRVEDARLQEGQSPKPSSISMDTNVVQNKNSIKSKPCNGKHSVISVDRITNSVAPHASLDAPGLGTCQRAFPRTNPTVSRLATGSGTGRKSSIFSATTLDRPTNTNFNVQRANLGQSRHSIGSSSSAQRNPAFNVIHFSSTDLRTSIPRMPNGADNSSYQLDDSQIQLCENQSCQDVSPPGPLNESSVAMAPSSLHSADMPMIRVNNRSNRKSPNSESPQPSSSSSSSSFSRASSDTALTNTDSEEGRQVGRSAPNQILDTALVGAFSLVDAQTVQASIQPETNTCGVNPFQQSVSSSPLDLMDGTLDLEQPPVPPPRSASTLGPNRLLLQQQQQQQPHCTSDFYRLMPGGLGARSDPCALVQRPYPVFYPRYPQYAIQHPHMAALVDANLIGDGHVVSSLSRKDPARAHVIPRNHRRPPPFAYHTRPAYPMSDQSTVYYVIPADGLLHEAATTGCQSAANHRLSSTSSPLLPSTGAEMSSIGSSGNGPTGATSPSTATTWISHSTATWDLEQLHAEHGVTLTNAELEQQIQPSLSSVQRSSEPQTVAVSTNRGTLPIATVLQRSPSGGFVGPEELNESVWFSTSDRERAGPPLPLFTLVQPGHPRFANFIAQFDWPRTLFKPDQDVASLMSWTKSTFSKRLLLSTESNMKKQAADTFKIIQSFMGDRKARLSLPDYGSIIVHRALTTVGLRDEIFAQLCKQTTGNPDIKSLTNGWALICVCLHYFPPNSKFRDHFLAYLNARAEMAVSNVAFPSGQSMSKLPSSLETAAAIASGLAPIVSELKPIANGHVSSVGPGARAGSTMGSVKSDALLSESSEFGDSELSVGRNQNSNNNNQGSRQFEFSVGLWDRPTAAHFARVAPRWFVRALNVGPRKLMEAPSIEEICHVKDFILKPSIFGGTLAEMMRIQAYRFPHLRLPWIQIFLTEELLRLNGSTTEGIFRLSPDLDLVTEIRYQLEKLFEIFRVVHVCVLDPEYNQADDQQQHPASCFRILRPPPSGWSLSLREFQTESGLSELAIEDASFTQTSSPTLGNCVPLTGSFTWPLTPVGIRLPPAEYVLLTPTSQWPCSLSAMATRLSVASNADPQVDPHLAAGLLKLWLREMPNPLVPVELQPECLKAACEAELFESHQLNKSDVKSFRESACNSNPIHTCCSLIRKIPPLERRSLLYLILLLQHLAKREHASLSLMDARNLATVIAPNLMRSISTNPRELLENIRPQTLFVRLLITYLDVDTELQYLLDAERDDDVDDFLLTTNTTASGIGFLSRGRGDTAAWCAPVRVRLGPDNGLLPA